MTKKTDRCQKLQDADVRTPRDFEERVKVCGPNKTLRESLKRSSEGGLSVKSEEKRFFELRKAQEYRWCQEKSEKESF